MSLEQTFCNGDLQEYIEHLLRECFSWVSKSGVLQMIFLTLTKTMFLTVLREYTFDNVE